MLRISYIIYDYKYLIIIISECPTLKSALDCKQINIGISVKIIYNSFRIIIYLYKYFKIYLEELFLFSSYL